MATSKSLLLMPAAASAAFTVNQKKKNCKDEKDFIISSGLSAGEKKLICVTAGNSYLGSHLIKQLLAHSYLVRVIIQHQANFEDMRKLVSDEEMNKLECVVVAKMEDLDSLCNAFIGCYAVFHTSSFIDPHGVAGYSEQMVSLETEAARNVIEACGRTESVNRCIFTSSLLASVWNGNKVDRVIDESCWSNEEFCRENKLWLALGKTSAEKLAWKMSKELNVNLVTVCPGLLMAPSFPDTHTTSVPYLKGWKVMLQQGLLATSDVKNVAEAHVHIYEAMNSGACGRYFCFNRVIGSLEEAIELENGLKMLGLLSRGRQDAETEQTEELINSKLSNSRLSRLLSQASKSVSCKQMLIL